MKAFVVSTAQQAEALQRLLGPSEWRVLSPGVMTAGCRFDAITMAINYHDPKFASDEYRRMVDEWSCTLVTRTAPGCKWLWLT